MKKTILAVSIAAIAAPSMAATADDFKVEAYLGAELGGNLSTSSELRDAGTFEYENELKAGAEISKQLNKDFNLFVGTEVRYGIEGYDNHFTDGKYDDDSTEIHRFSVGVDTVAGRTEFGVIEGLADTYDGFADLSMEHGLEADFESAIDNDQTLQHVYTTDLYELAASYDFESKAVAVMGKVKPVENLTLGAAFVEAGDDELGTDLDTQSYTLGAIYSVDKNLDVAAKYVKLEAGNNDTESFSFGTAYKLNEEIKLAGTYNSVDKDGSDRDDYFTVGASYQLNKNVEFVTDYKVTSEEDDQIFVRANINF